MKKLVFAATALSLIAAPAFAQSSTAKKTETARPAKPASAIGARPVSQPEPSSKSTTSSPKPANKAFPTSKRTKKDR